MYTMREGNVVLKRGQDVTHSFKCPLSVWQVCFLTHLLM